MTQQRLILGPQKNLKNAPPSSPNLVIESPNFLTHDIFHKQNSKRLNKILCHTRALDSVFHSIQLQTFSARRFW